MATVATMLDCGDLGSDGQGANRQESDRRAPGAEKIVAKEDTQESIKLLSPPGLRGARPWDDWDDEGHQSLLNKTKLGAVVAPLGLHGGNPSGDLASSGHEATLTSWPPYDSLVTDFEIRNPLAQGLEHAALGSREPVLQAMSLPCEDWKKLFPPSFVSQKAEDRWRTQEPAVLKPMENSVAEESQAGAEEQPAYVRSQQDPTDLASENELLAAENARLAMENELLRSKYMSAPWNTASNVSEMSPYANWSGDGSSPNMDMWLGANPFYPTPWSPMMPMPHGQMPMWRWNGDEAGMMHDNPQKHARARTDSALDLQVARARAGSGDVGRSRTLSMNDVSDSLANSEELPVGPLTTVMLRNLPNNYSRAMLLKLIDAEGFCGQYDFIYLPMDFKSHASLGYAFVNLATSEEARRFFETFEGFHRWVVPSQKVCSVNWSHPYQGFDAHIERYRNSPVMHEDVPDDYKPMVFHNGERIVFPPPTKKLKVPRMRPGQEKGLQSEGALAEE